MRKLAILAALATTALATPALARDNAWYVGIEGGATIVEDLDFDISRAPAVGAVAVRDSANADLHTGYDVGGLVGYDFGMFRLEGEVAYKRNRVDSITTTGLTNSGLAVAPAGTYELASGENHTLSFMVNGLLDFGPNDGLQGYVGGGAGLARVKLARYKVVEPSNFLDDSDTNLAWQALAGVRYPVGQNVDLGLKYRFFNVRNIDTLGRVVADNYKTDVRSHSLLASLIYNFGAAAEAAPEAPPPPPPPAPVEAAPPPPPPPPAVPGPFIIFFDFDKSNITPEAATILDNAAQAFQTTGQAQIVLAGHADRSGSDAYNQALSERRSAAAKAYLMNRGIADSAIATTAFGESRPLVQTADGVREAQNRRVEITFGAPAM
jgi:OmpA-OmpF porin, OOP family